MPSGDEERPPAYGERSTAAAPSADVSKTGKDGVLFTIDEHFRTRQVKKLSHQIAVFSVVHHESENGSYRPARNL